MKGIRKLFLGLVFLALVGVGFTVNAKAADENAVGLTTDKGGATWQSDATKLIGSFKVSQLTNLFPSDPGDYYEYSFTVTDPTGTVTVTDVYTATRVSDTVTTWEKNGAVEPVPDEVELFTLTRADLIAAFNDTAGWEKEFQLNLKKSANGGTSFTIATKTFTARGYYLEPKATYKKAAAGAPAIGFVPDKWFMMENESKKFTTIGSAGKGYSFDGWYFGDTKLSGSESECTVSISNASPDSELISNYDMRTGLGLEYTDKALADAVIAKGGKVTRKFKFVPSGCGYTASDIDTTAAHVIVNPGTASATTHAVTINSVTGGESGTITFTFPNVSSSSPVEFVVATKDGIEFPVQLSLIDPSAVEFSITPNTTQTIEVGEKITYVPTLTPDFDNAEFTYPLAATDKDCISTTKDAGGNLYVTGAKVTTTGASFTPTVKYTVEGADTIEKTLAPLTVKVTSPSLVFTSDIMVNEGLSAPLSRFVKNENTYVAKAEAKSSSYITVSPATGVARSIEIKGKSATKKVSGEFTADGQTAAVTVYPKPTLSLDKSGSGSSLKYTFKVTMPWNVYHGSTVIKDLSKAKIQFKGEKDTYTLDSFSLEKDTEDYTKKNKDTVSVDIKKMGEILNKICKNDKEEIEITAYADGDKDVISDKQTLKVYKIKVDGSSGADYKVNGETVSDYFYAIDGVSYEVSTTPKSGYSGTPEKWDGTSFGTNSNGTVSFSESKTIKAYYKGGTSSPSTSGRNSGAAGDGTGEGYDDVPKTGESKTDIWILWSVLFISILGAGFMIWKRFGLARAIAEADQQVAIAEHEEMVKAEEKEKKDKLDMLKGLRNL